MQRTESGRPALVLLGGELAGFDIRSREWCIVVAADGGARHALRQGVPLHHVIGDFDSLPPDDWAKLEKDGVPTTRLPREKDMTDGEAAVRWVLEHSDAGVVVIAGGLGGRFDHALGSVALLEQLAQAGRRGCVTDGRQTVYLLVDRLVLRGTPGDVVSVVPLTPTVTGVNASGVRWPLKDATLTAASTLSVSNELTAPSACFSARQGRAVVVHVPQRTLELGDEA